MTLVAIAPGGPTLDVRGLTVTLDNGAPIVSDIDLPIAHGRIVGLVGESGSGKSTIANALSGHARRGTAITGGHVLIDGIDMTALDAQGLRNARGRIVANVAQDPATALNPMMRIGDHLDEVLVLHHADLRAQERRARIEEVAQAVGLPTSHEFLRRFPHQLSGGQQQRVLLALAFVLRPKLIVLDEPTTALDVTTQAQVLTVIRQLCRERGIAALYVSHDLAVVRNLVDDIVVLYSGRIVERGARDPFFEAPAHPYARGLLAAIPDVSERVVLHAIPGQAPTPSDRPAGCVFAPRCSSQTERCIAERPTLERLTSDRWVACHHPSGSRFEVGTNAGLIDDQSSEALPVLTAGNINLYYDERQILFDVGFDLPRAGCTALVGESGSGKTTLARALVGLGEAVSGTVVFDGEPFAVASAIRPKEIRRRIQYVFQNPYRALNPRQTVGDILKAAIRHFFPVDPVEASARAAAALERVALPHAILARRPHDLSGGERQRVAIARALVCEPDLLICDEITSALDVSVQAAILALIATLQADGLTVLFVTHDLAVVRAIADKVIVLRGGRIVEQGPADMVLDRPTHGYTAKLMADSPRLHGDVASVPPLAFA